MMTLPMILSDPDGLKRAITLSDKDNASSRTNGRDINNAISVCHPEQHRAVC